MSFARTLFLLSLSIGASYALVECPAAKHEVTSLPGFGKPTSRWVSGFIDAGLLPGMEEFGHMCFHYTFIESLGSPKTDPVLIWYQGGPGAPGLFGLLLEFGPLLLNADSLRGNYSQSGMPQPVSNRFSWARGANLLIMDNTPPIGFSYCTAAGPTANASQCGSWTDTSTFAANHKALTTFFNKIMPELRDHEVFIAGESYGGIYVPGIASLLIEDPQGVKIKGVAVGDGCMGTDVLCIDLDASPPKYPNTYPGPFWDVLFFHGHGQVSNELHTRIMNTCPDKELKGVTRPLSASCQSLIDEMFAALGGYFAYDIIDECDWSWLSDGGAKYKGEYRFHPNGYACPSPAHERWLAKKEVRVAMGLPIDSRYILVDNGDGFTYTPDVKDVRPMWLKIVDAGVRVLTYSGDMDANVNGFITQDLYVDLWREAGHKQTQPWRPWTIDGEKHMGGYVIEWGNGTASFVSVRGSGHMVPEFKAQASAVMFENWISRKDLPRYEPRHLTKMIV